MTYAQFASLIRFRTKTDSTTFTDADIVILANAVKQEITQRVIHEVDEDYFGSIATTDLVAGQREYPFPSDLLNKIKYVEVKFDPTITDASAWMRLDEFDINTYKRPTSEAYIVEKFSNDLGRAFYDIYRGSLWIYSGAIIESTAGLKLWYPSDVKDLVSADLASTTEMSVPPSDTTHGMPEPLQELWARRVQIEYKEAAQQPIPLTEKELSWRADLDAALEAMKGGNFDRAYLGAIPEGGDIWDNGFNL